MASFIINRSPLSAIDFKIPEEVWLGSLVDHSSLKIFGCPTYVHVQSGEHSKLDSNSRKCVFLGFENGVKGYRLWDPTEKSRKNVINLLPNFRTNSKVLIHPNLEKFHNTITA